MTDKSEAAVDKAYREIRQLIINYEYKPGDRLYETTLADIMEMSRTPIREALARLLSCGFLERDPNHRGYKVPALSAKDMQTVFRLRLVLDEHIIRLAALRIEPKDIAFLYDLNEKEKKFFREENRAVYADLNEQFHLALTAISEDVYAMRCARELISRTTLYGVFFGGFYTKVLMGRNVNVRLKPAHIEHRAVIDSLAQGDAESACRAIRQHILNTYSHYSGHELEEISAPCPTKKQRPEASGRPESHGLS